MTPLVILGAGGHGRVVHELVSALGGFSIVGFLDIGVQQSSLHRSPILGGDDLLPQLWSQGVRHAFVALGQNRLRQQVGAKVRALNFGQPCLVHPSAFVAPSARLGDGALVMARAVLGTDAALGEHAILNTGAIVDHDGMLADACHVAPGCALAGQVTVGARTLVGVGSSVRPGITIGADVVIGAGSAVVSDLPDGVWVGGAPAKLLRKPS
ncbi:hexapeptide transferase [Bosea caraganae]|uniref:Hexapeptide transferase n=1 Tax=Bosea caraganae TaxID=2763117 RepID=A0A370L826_9HYPH|nr:acetyltransferase [Bosea caraganae]RDJ25199.1 hexapeptide transferase [Bosea caraganae]RDJ26309.1 hexapeptide transferase [Bosea caraganae]